MKERELPREAEADARAFPRPRDRAVDLVKTVEYAVDLLRSDPDSGILHGDLNGASVLAIPQRDRYMPAFGSEFASIGKEVRYDFPDDLAVEILVVHSVFLLHPERDASLFVVGKERLRYAPDEFGRIPFYGPHAHSARVDLRKIQQLVDQAQKTVRVARHHFQPRARSVRRRISLIMEKVVEGAQDQGQRSTNFVGNVLEKMRFLFILLLDQIKETLRSFPFRPEAILRGDGPESSDNGVDDDHHENAVLDVTLQFGHLARRQTVDRSENAFQEESDLVAEEDERDGRDHQTRLPASEEHDRAAGGKKNQEGQERIPAHRDGDQNQVKIEERAEIYGGENMPPASVDKKREGQERVQSEQLGQYKSPAVPQAKDHIRYVHEYHQKRAEIAHPDVLRFFRSHVLRYAEIYDAPERFSHVVYTIISNGCLVC